MYVNVMSSQADKKRLLGIFDHLKVKCAKVLKTIANARYELYVSYAEIYVWWREAAKVDGLVDGLTGLLSMRCSSPLLSLNTMISHNSLKNMLG